LTSAPAADERGALAAIDALREGVAAGRVLELDVARGEAVVAEASERLGIAPDAYVVALVGGTGVGKSTILNALGGREVSLAGVRRPTTDKPIAWVAAGAMHDVRPLLERLGVERAQTKTHERADLGQLVILDLPDVDSLEPSHRATVEALLPKLDVVAWVTDPEKYADAVLHDDFLRTWMPRLARQIVVLNKSDRLSGQEATVVRDLRRVLARDVPVLSTTASEGEAGIAPLRDWLAEAIEAKTVVVARLRASAAAALADLAGAAGVRAGARDAGPLVPEAQQRRAIEGATDEVLRVVDLKGAEQQAVAATRARARRRGTGPIGILTSAIYRYSGRQRRAADPAEHLRGWRTRGGLARATELIRRAIEDALPGVPPGLRARYAAVADARDLERRLETALDRVIARNSDVEPPSSRIWPFIGLLQSANTLLLIFAVAWVVLWVVARPEVASYNLPVLGPVPAPMVLLFVALAGGYLFARLLSIHAGWVGRRWARRLTGEVRRVVSDVMAVEAFAPLAQIEAARMRLAAAYSESATGPTAPRS
jgi:hypothetical protein